MATVNIPSTCDDPCYRYKMPRLVTQKEGRLNGRKTCIVNMGDVARALKRPPQYTTKWFGNELGALSTYTCKEGEGERAIVNGHHGTHIFQALLDKFIEKYVLCYNCHLPEINMRIKKGNIFAKCAACGWAGNLDNGHKLAAFITKNPPDETGFNIIDLAEAGGGKPDKNARRELKATKAKGKHEKHPDAEDQQDGGHDNEDAKKKKDKKCKKEKKEKKDRKDKRKKNDKEMPKEKEEEDDFEGDDGDADVDVDASEEEDDEKYDIKDENDRSKKGKKEKKETSGEPESASEGSGDPGNARARGKQGDELEYNDEEIGDLVHSMRSWLESERNKATPDLFMEELRLNQLTKGFDHKIRLFVALEALFGTAMDAKALSGKNKFVGKVISRASMESQEVLWAFGAYLEMNSAAVKVYPMVLKAIYDLDWAGEAEIIKYYCEDQGESDPGFNAAKRAAAPFLNWLITAESEEEDEEQEDGDNDGDDSD